MNSRLAVESLVIVALFLATGCATFQAGTAVQSGRNALQTGRPEAAIGYLRSAAEIHPEYRHPDALQTSVWTYLGRAYYEAGNYTEAQRALERALSMKKDDHVARLYHGLALLRTGDEKSGRPEAERGLRGINIWLQRLTANMIEGAYWDPAGRLRANLRYALAKNGTLPTPEFIAVAQQIGSSLDVEVDRQRRDEAADKFRTDP
jgi:tetratricopeptide (TPR) repeat protein